MTRLLRSSLRSSLLLLAACGFQPTASQATSDGAPRAIDGAPVIVRGDAATDAKHFEDAGTTQNATFHNCADALAAGVTSDGTVTIDPDGMGGAPPYQVFCDQTTAGGGWALVWVYTFTNYDSFQDLGNAVTPRPTWSGAATTGTTPTSTTTPASRTSTGALDFTKWASLGDEVMATSDINHWVKCQPGSGSVVDKVDGTLTCQMVMTVPNKCLTTVPAYWGTNLSAGLGFFASSSASSAYYFYDGSTTTNWPTHDPCGTNAPNQVDDAPSPHGQLWVRHR